MNVPPHEILSFDAQPAPLMKPGLASLVALTAALVLLAGVGVVGFRLGHGSATPVATSTYPPSATYDTDNAEVFHLQEGECVRSTDPNGVARLERSDCDAGSAYLILKRYSGTSDTTRCNAIVGTTTAYRATPPEDDHPEVVLCLGRV